MSLYIRQEIKEDPLKRLDSWVQEAINKKAPLPHAMSLATVDSNGQPSSRMVLMKSLSDKGIVFFTDYRSRKGIDISINPLVAATFWWPITDKQVRVEGSCKKISQSDSDKYFDSRPRGAKISASLSIQSKEIQSHEYLISKASAFDKDKKGLNIQRPDQWGGFILQPSKVEFWVNQENRLHKRILFTLTSSVWTQSILSP